MASAKQIAWRKKFARMSKAGKFKKTGGVKNPSRSQLKAEEERKKTRLSGYANMKRKMDKRSETKSGGNLIYGKTPEYHRKKLRELGYTERTINKFLRSHGKL